MKHLLTISMALGIAAASLSPVAVQAQTVEVNALGSSALFLELGLGANYSGSGGLNNSCVWSGTATATDKSTGSSLTDSGNAWVEWTPGTGGTCSSPSTNSVVYSYLQTDSVVGNRCLFNGSNCTIAYPTTNPAPAGLILGTSGEVALPVLIANKVNAFAVNAAGTDIRPEDAKFAINRALTACGTPIVSGSQYLGLGYTNGSTIKSTDKSFNVINFTLPSSFYVTNVGATPVLVVVNSNDSSAGLGQSGVNSFTSSVLAKFLDGTDSYSDQLLSSNPSASGDKVTVYLREPLSGTYNTLEYNIPNSTVNQTSQDVGKTQPSGQVNCSGSVPKSNPMNIATTSGGARIRAIGTGEELADVQTNSGGNSLGYGFWSVANYAKLATVSTAKYLRYNTGSALVDPLLKSGSSYSGAIPTTGSAELANVDLSTTANGSYPVYSLIRLVNVGSTQNANVKALASSADLFVSFGSTTSRPDFVTPSKLSVVRSHFTPPGVSTAALANGDSKLGAMNSPCNAAEAGGDVGGVIYTLTADGSYCTSHSVKTGQTGNRI